MFLVVSSVFKALPRDVDQEPLKAHAEAAVESHHMEPSIHFVRI